MEWHTKSGTDVLSILGTDSATGLCSPEAAKRNKKHGPNTLKEVKRESRVKRLVLQFTQFIIIVLLAAAVLAGIMGEWIDAGAIIAIVLVNGLIGFLQEEKAERVMEALKRLTAPSAKVVRDGKPATINAAELVPGDIVLLESGDHVPADMRLIESVTLRINEAALTGESLPIDKTTETLPGAEAEPSADTFKDIERGVVDDNTASTAGGAGTGFSSPSTDSNNISPSAGAIADRINMAFLGTNVVYGRGTGVVIATGMSTEMGRIAHLLQQVKTGPTPLQQRLSEFTRVLVFAAIGICALVFILGIIRGNDFMEMLLTAVSLAVAAIPEGLPAVVTVVLALGVQRMAKRNALIRKLPSVETLGAATVIASDKTGTLTQNQMTVKRLYLPNGTVVSVTGTGYAPTGNFSVKAREDGQGTNKEEVEGFETKLIKEIVTTGVMASSATININEETGQWNVVGDPTEGALVSLSLKGGVDKEELLKGQHLLTELPFDSTRKMMTTVYAKPGSATGRAYVKGAIESVLQLCTRRTLSDGRLIPFSAKERERVLEANKQFTGQAMRVLCLAFKTIEETTATPHSSEELESDLVFAGLVGMIDPPREEVKEAVAVAKKAGILPLMITGDHKLTAIAIAKEIGTFTDTDLAITGIELDQMNEAEFTEKLPRIKVYARVNPEHKMRVVRAWRNRGDIIAMTGDGVNDAPALKEADIGIAMGITGTDVTTEAADMVLVDDNFATIVSAIKEGRGIFSNIRRVVHFLLSCNIGEIIVLLAATLIGMPLPLLPVQILWTNLVTDSLPALGLAMEPVKSTVMEEPPRGAGGKKSGIVTKKLLRVMLLQGLIIAACTLGAYSIDLYYFNSALSHARTVAFTTLVLSQNFHSFNCRSVTRSIFSLGLKSNGYLSLAVLLILSSQLLLIYLPALQSVFKLTPLTGTDWVVVGVTSLLPLFIGESVKLIQRRRKRR